MLESSIKGFLRALSSVLVISALVGAMGCAAPAKLSEKQQQALEQRVSERWQTLIAKDFDSAWEFTTPNYRRVFPKSLYVNKFSYAVDWELTGIEVVNYDAPAAVASVVVRVMSKPTKQTSSASIKLGALPTTIGEKWILIDRQWWYSAND